MKTLYVVSLCLYLHLFATAAHCQLRKIYLQPKTTAREKQSSFIDSIRFIPLEIKEAIEPGTRYHVEITAQYLLVIEHQNRRVMVYTPEGHFVRTINYKKLGEDFYPVYQEQDNRIIFFGNNKNYTLTAGDQVQIRLDWANPRNKKYFKKYTIDLADSTFAIQKAVPEERDVLSVYPYYDDYYLQGRMTTSSLYKDSLDQELKLYRNNQLVKTFFPYNRISEPRYRYTSEGITFTKTDTPYIRSITRPYCDTVYRMVKDSLAPAYQLVLPLENSLPASFFTRPFNSKTERDNFNRNNGWMLHQVYHFYETPRFILLGISYLSNYDTYLYEKQKGVTYKTRNIRADSSQYNLDILSDFSSGRKGNRFYKSLRAGEVLSFFDKNKAIPVPKELEAFLQSKPPDDAPLIVEYTFKK